MGLGIIGSIIIGGLAGWIASLLMRARTGLVVNVVLGIVGAVLLNYVLARVGIYADGTWMSQLIIGAAGAAILIWLGRALRRR